MNDMNPRAVIGGNNPPDPIDTICAAYEGVRMEAEHWLDGQTAIETEEVASAVSRIRKEAQQWRLDLERGQKDATEPLYDRYKAESARWKPTIDDAKRIESGLVTLLNDFKVRLDAEKRAAARAAFEAAEAARRYAEKLALQAAADDLAAQREVAAAAAVADEAQRVAVVAQQDKVTGLRTVTRYRIEDYRAAINDINQHDKAALTAFVDDYVRRNHKLRAIAGVSVWKEKEAF